MSKYLITVLLFFISLINTAYGQNKHSIGAFSALSTKQTGAPGLALKYQWQFDQSFAFESLLSNSGDIDINTHLTSYKGDQTLLSIGAVFLKQYSPNLTIKFSGGGNYVITSSSNFFIQQSSISPYLTLALEYQVSDNFYLEAGQSSYFQNDQLGNHHTLFIGVNYVFNSSINTQTNSTGTVKRVTSETKHPFSETIPTPTTSLPSTIVSKAKIITNSPTWVLQLGAYSNELNADQALITLKQKYDLTLYRVVFDNSYFRIVSPSHDSYEAALQSSISLKKNLGITNLIKQQE